VVSNPIQQGLKQEKTNDKNLKILVVLLKKALPPSRAFAFKSATSSFVTFCRLPYSQPMTRETAFRVFLENHLILLSQHREPPQE
jgi:hypothetical protein